MSRSTRILRGGALCLLQCFRGLRSADTLINPICSWIFETDEEIFPRMNSAILLILLRQLTFDDDDEVRPYPGGPCGLRYRL
jgi:hypothetical protein